MSTPKETAYDEHIAPLMEQIIALCRTHKINAFATFALDLEEDGLPLMCTTALPLDKADEYGSDLVDRLRRVTKPEHHTVALTITTKAAT